MTARVELRGVRKCYGPVEAVRAIDLDIEPGELMVLVGPSGCGKSTVLRMIAGLEEVTEGTIRIGDRDVTDLPPRDRDVAMVFQSYALYPHMSVRRNLDFGLRMRGVPRNERDALVAEAAALLELTELLERRPRQLSGGQRQRVALGRAIVRKPAVFLFDEPLSNLDARLRTQTRVEIARLQRELGTTAVYVTHDQVEAMTLGHRIAVLRDGCLEQAGPPMELYRRPATAFVATFLGSPPMSLLPGRLLAGNRVRVAGATLVLAAVAPGGTDERDVLVGLRPEALALVSDEGGVHEPVLRGTVEVVEPLGSQLHIQVRVSGAPVSALLPPVDPPALGSEVTLRVAAKVVHLFDADSGRRLG